MATLAYMAFLKFIQRYRFRLCAGGHVPPAQVTVFWGESGIVRSSICIPPLGALVIRTANSGNRALCKFVYREGSRPT